MTASLPPPIFDQTLMHRQRARAVSRLYKHAALHAAVAAELNERLQDVARAFTQVLLWGAGLEGLQVKGSETLAATGPLDETLPFAPASFDLLVSNFALHRVNDVPGMLAQCYALLKPGGLFLAAFPGGETLGALRQCLIAAELAVTGGVSPRVHPTIAVSDASALLQRAGFQLPVTDSERYVLTYPDFMTMLRELRGMGEGNALTGRLRQPTRRAVFVKAAELYRAYAQDGALPLVFDIIYLHGWKA